MIKQYNVLSNKVKIGKNVTKTLEQIADISKCLVSIAPLIETDIVKIVIDSFDTANDLQIIEIINFISTIIETPYKHLLASNNLDWIMKLLKCNLPNKNTEIMTRRLCIMKELFEIDETIIEKVLKCNGFDIITTACKLTDTKVLKLCAINILLILMYGNKNSHNNLMKIDKTAWLFPLYSNEKDKTIPYFIYFALNYLQSELNFDFCIQDGILHIIRDFLYENHLFIRMEGALNCKNTVKILKKLLPLLNSKCRMMQTFATMQICCELSSNMDNREAYYDCKLISTLRRLAIYSNDFTSNLAQNALRSLTNVNDMKIQRIEIKPVREWRETDVQKWLKTFDFDDFLVYFSGVNGEKFLAINKHDLKTTYFMLDPYQREQFLNERTELCKILSEENIKIRNQESISYNDQLNDKEAIAKLTPDEKISLIETPFNTSKKTIDVFISYRRQGGSDLASLIYFALKTKGYKVFLDVQSLRGGKFGENLKTSIQESRNFVLLLTKDALSRCTDEDDWIRLEIEMALKSK
jgi:hypothetical protein